MKPSSVSPPQSSGASHRWTQAPLLQTSSVVHTSQEQGSKETQNADELKLQAGSNGHPPSDWLLPWRESGPTSAASPRSDSSAKAAPGEGDPSSVTVQPSSADAQTTSES